jgi:hypothetical protein
MIRPRRGLCGLAATLLVAGCAQGLLARRDVESASALPPYEPTRRDYLAFRAKGREPIEPNYLPFMAHPVVLEGQGLLVFCRWADDRFPLPVYVDEPAISSDLQDEFHPQTSSSYVEAVERALRAWEHGLEGLVRFRRVSWRADAALRVRLIGELAPTPGPAIKVLGSTSMRGACRALGGDASADRVTVAYEIPEVRIFIADEFGLLTPDQVERVALHELGHALGMRSHSRRPKDLMYEAMRDRFIFAAPSIQDLNSFVNLYRLPNGTVYKRGPWGPEPEAAAPPKAARAPELAIAPHVDARHGFELRPPAGWMRIEMPTGMVAVDGVSWDYDATLEVIVRNYPTIESYLDRHGPAHLVDSRVLRRTELEVAGRRAVRLAVRGPGGVLAEDMTLVEAGDGRVFIVIGFCESGAYEAYRPWFDAVLDSLEIREATSHRADDAAPFSPAPGL